MEKTKIPAEWFVTKIHTALPCHLVSSEASFFREEGPTSSSDLIIFNEEKRHGGPWLEPAIPRSPSRSLDHEFICLGKIEAHKSKILIARWYEEAALLRIILIHHPVIWPNSVLYGNTVSFQQIDKSTNADREARKNRLIVFLLIWRDFEWNVNVNVSMGDCKVNFRFFFWKLNLCSYEKIYCGMWDLFWEEFWRPEAIRNFFFNFRCTVDLHISQLF